ncbi:MAG: DNA polymerase III subunit delta [Chloroflexota bacterium]|nr:DNA polymerase III subunit delta [Chloroflexota bacterium]
MFDNNTVAPPKNQPVLSGLCYNPDMLYILHGPDRFSLREMLERLKEDLGAGDLTSSNTTALDGKQVSLQELMSVCSTVPFLAPRRLVAVEGLLARFEPRGNASASFSGRTAPPQVKTQLAAWLPLKEYLPRMPYTTLLVLVEGKLRRDNPLLKELAPQAKVMEFPEMKGPDLQNWVRLRVRKAGGEMSPTAVRLLADLVGADLGVLAGEIEKLCLYGRGRRIEETDVRLLVNHAREASVFSLVDALVQRQTPQALRALHQLLDEGAVAPYLLFMITRQFRFLLRAQELVSQGLRQEVLAQRLGLSGYPLRKTLQQAEEYEAERLEEVYRGLRDTDLAVKTGRQDPELALDLLVAELCRGRTARLRTY